MLKLNNLGLSSLLEQNKKITTTKQLDISNNLLTNLEGVDVWCENLKWLNASHNQIKGVKHLKSCLKINVLNLSYNKISSIKNLNKLKALNALILNNNELKCLDGMSSLTELNTLILSSNNLGHVDVTSLKQLQKFSASHNELKEFPLLQSQKDLKDLKLNNNKIVHIPDWFVSSCIRIKILDLGNNCLKDFDSIKCLCKLPYLENLNLKGNPLSLLGDYHMKIKEMFPKLKILDFKKLSDLYYKAIECQSKESKDTPILKDSKAEVLETTVTANKPSQKTDITDAGSNHGFKSKKVKRKDGSAQLVTENNENISSILSVNEEIIKSSTLEKTDINNIENLDAGQKRKERKRSRSNVSEVENVSSASRKESDLNTPSKKRKNGKKRKHASIEPENTSCHMKKNEENGHVIIMEDSSIVKYFNKDGRTSVPKENEKKKGGGKKSSKTTGIVEIIKTASSQKKQESFDYGDLYDTHGQFGMGGGDAWT